MNDRPVLELHSGGISDADKAKEYREKLTTLYEPICDLFTEMSRQGFACQVNIGMNPAGRSVIIGIAIAKPL